MPVFNGRFGFTLNYQNGDIISIGSDSYPGIDISLVPGLSPDEAKAFARKQLRPEAVDSLVVITETELVIYPERTKQNILHHLTYKVEIDDYANGERWRYFVEAHSGTIIASQQLWRDGNWTVNGNVKGQYWPVNSGGSQQEAFPKYLTAVKVYNILGQEISSDVIDGSGNYSMSGNHAYQTFYVDVVLKGSWAKIKNPSSQVDLTQTFVTSGNSTRNFNFTNTTDGFHVYHHMNEIHDFIKGSPFNYNGMDYQMEARVNDNTVPNARAFGTRLSFSSNSGRRWWESSDVVYHEYTHNVVYDLYGDFIGTGNAPWQDEAMDEGIADYFAASLNQDSQIDWVNRDVSNPLTFQDDFINAQNNQHHNGQILSGAMWDLESTTSQYTARRLNFKAMQITPQPDTYVEFVDNVILADDNNGKLCDGTPHYNKIIAAFQTNHGIVPTLTVGQPLSVNITGPGILGWKEQGTYTANVTGCSPFTYEWRKRYNGTGSWSGVEGTSQQYSRTMLDTDFELQVKVTSGGQSVYDTHYVSYEGLAKKGTEVATQIPERFSLEQNYPNPFNPTTEIKLALPENGHVTLSIFNVVGQKIRTLIDQRQEAGYHSVIWDGKDEFGNEVASGIYVYRIYVHSDKADGKSFESFKKMTLLR